MANTEAASLGPATNTQPPGSADQLRPSWEIQITPGPGPVITDRPRTQLIRLKLAVVPELRLTQRVPSAETVMRPPLPTATNRLLATVTALSDSP